MSYQKKQIIYILFISLFLVFSFQNASNSEWITKKSEKKDKLAKIDDMYSNGYLTKSECTKAKAKILNLTNASGMCDHINVIAKKIFKQNL